MLALLCFASVSLADTDELHPSFVTSEGKGLVLLRTEVDAEVSVGLSVVDVKQVFDNPFETPIDATYVFPLPEDAAVRDMRMTCGERTIVGEIATKEEAKKRYQQARREGKKAALLEQQRRNVFTQHVASICPGETVTVELQYVEQLAYEDQRYTLVFPTTMGPRFDPGHRLEQPPYIAKADGRTVDITVTIDEGLAIGDVYSDTHDFVIEDEGEWGAEIVLDSSDRIPNKDFHLSWSLAGSTPRASAVTHIEDGQRYVAVTLEPQLLEDLEAQRKRELLFVLDSSCSMRGTPWQTATQVVELALDEMMPYDTFNLVKFSNAAGSLFVEPQPATAENVDRAKQWLGSFMGGGTVMTAGIEHSLNMPGDPEAMRLVLFLTDGFIGSEDVVFRVTRENLGDARIFSLGVGSSVNRHLLGGLAYYGRGDATYQLPGTPLDETVANFYDRIAHPAMTDIEIDWGGLSVHSESPVRVPDLWAGQPVRVVAKVDNGGSHDIRLTGLVDGFDYELPLRVDLSAAGEHEAVSTLWARNTIADLTWDRSLVESERRETITDVALEHHLVSAYTSLVAVDETPSACGGAANTVDVPSQVPHGVQPSAVGIGGLIGAKAYQSGYGGLGARGSGLGGGGTTSGITGRGTRGRGSGASGYGTGGGNFGARGEGGIGRIGSDPIIMGAMDKSLIDDVIKRHMNQIRYCYQRELQKDPSLSGKVTVKFVIAKDGIISNAEIKSSTMGNTAVESCLTSRFMRMRFPETKGGGIVIVQYPLIFSAKKDE